MRLSGRNCLIMVQAHFSISGGSFKSDVELYVLSGEDRSFNRETVTEENNFPSIEENKLISYVDAIVLSNGAATTQRHGHQWTRFTTSLKT